MSESILGTNIFYSMIADTPPTTDPTFSYTGIDTYCGQDGGFTPSSVDWLGLPLCLDEIQENTCGRSFQANSTSVVGIMNTIRKVRQCIFECFVAALMYKYMLVLLQFHQSQQPPSSCQLSSDYSLSTSCPLFTSYYHCARASPSSSFMTQNGGNAIEIENSISPIVLINLSVMRARVGDCEDIMQAQSNMISSFVAKSVELGLGNDFLYMNYASQYQAVINNYVLTNKARLDGVAEKYDLTGVLQRFGTEFFKLNGPE